MAYPELFPLASELPESKSIRYIAARYVRYWYWFALSVSLCLGAAYGYLKYYAVPQYLISSSLLIKNDEGTAPAGGAGFDLGMLASSKNLNNEVEVLRSRSLMQRVTKELNLTTTCVVQGRFKDTEIYGAECPIRVITSKPDSGLLNTAITIWLRKNNNTFELTEAGRTSVHRFGRLIHTPAGRFTVVANSNAAIITKYLNQQIQVGFHSDQTIANDFSQSIKISPVNKDATVLQVSLVDPLPARGKDVINKLVEVYNKEALEDKNLTAANTIRFLDERLKYITSELTGVEKDVEKYKSRNEVTDVQTQASNYLVQASDYDKKMSDWAVQIDVLESIERYLSKNNGQYHLVPSTLGIQDQTLLGLISKFNELQIERERMLRTTEPNNPLVQNINEQLANLQVNILENLRNIKRGLLITSNSLKASSGQFKARIQKVPSLERELLEINRQQEIKQKLYLYLLQKREESALSLAATVANSRTIDAATSTGYPISPSKQVVYLVALLAGLLIPFASIYAKELLDDKVQTQDDVERLTATPILGELAHNTQGTLVMTRANNTPLAEMFRLVRANLHFAAEGNNGKTILITSSMSREGKSFFSINLGATLALTGKRVVILELDLRQPSLLPSLDMAPGAGIADYLLSDHERLPDILRPVKGVANLFVIGAGTLAANPAELMMSPKLGYLLSELKETFDHVLIDTSPIGKVADAFSLRNYVNHTVFIVRYNYTLKQQIAIVDSIFRNKTLANPMIVLNDAKNQAGHSYGYGYGYDGHGVKNKDKDKSISSVG